MNDHIDDTTDEYWDEVESIKQDFISSPTAMAEELLFLRRLAKSLVAKELIELAEAGKE